MDTTQKFTGKAEVYVKARPGYAKTFLQYLKHQIGNDKEKTIADIGSGTGKLAEDMLKMGYDVLCVEPNDDMRYTAEEVLRGYKGFMSVKGTAEATTLGEKSVDYIMVAQAFHWFDPIAFRKECQRILKDEGKVFLIWNSRTNHHPLVKENEAICRTFCPDFKGFSGGLDKITHTIQNFYNNNYTLEHFENNLVFDREKFIGRMLSASYALKPDDAKYTEYIEALEEFFVKYAVDDTLMMPNETIMYVGRL